MSKIGKLEEIIYSDTEVGIATKLKMTILDAVPKLRTIVVEISLDDKKDVIWGHVYVAQDSDVEVWKSVADAKEKFAHLNGFPDNLIDVLPI